MQGRKSNYLRRQAEYCLALSRSTIDLALAGRLREMAEDFRRKAAEWDDKATDIPTRMMTGTARSTVK